MAFEKLTNVSHKETPNSLETCIADIYGTSSDMYELKRVWSVTKEGIVRRIGIIQIARERIILDVGRTAARQWISREAMDLNLWMQYRAES